MQKHFITIIIAIQFAFVTETYSQNVALNTTGNNADTSAMLDISSTNKGLLLPRMSTAQLTTIPLPATGLIVFNTSINAFQVNIGTAAIPNWQTLSTTNTSWLTNGNNGTIAGTNYIGTTDAIDFVTKTNGSERMRISSAGNVGIGTTLPGSALDIKGTIRLSGSTSGYVGLSPATAAGSTTYTLPTADGTSGQQLTTNGSGILGWASAAGTTTHTLSSSGNTVTSIVNGISTTANAVNAVSNTSSTNTLSTTVNGITGANVNIINSNTLGVSGQSLTSTVNGVASSALNLATIDSSIYKTDGALRANRTVTMGANNLTFNSTIGNLIFNPSSTGKVGIGTTSPNYSLHIHDATVNPSGGTWMQISNNASGSGSYDGFYYGVSSTGVPQIWAENYLDIITGSGTTNNTTMRLLANGNVGLGTTNPGSALDVKGALRLSGSTSGYVGFTPAAAAGSTTYTLPSADGSNGQQLTTNGSGVLSWASAGSGGSGWSLTGNSGTSSSTNYIGTSDNNDLVFKRNAIAAGALTANNTSFGVSTYVTGSNNVAIGTSAQTQTSNAVAVGQGTYIDHQYGVAIGNGAQTQGTSAISIGENAYTSGANSIAIGGDVTNKTQAQGDYAISLGYKAYSSSQDAIAIGDHAQAQGTNTTVIGTNLYNGSNNTVAIGNSSVTSFLLNGASAGGSKAIVVGSSSSNGNGAYLTTGGTWTNASDRNLKDGFSNIDETDILNKISQLEITRWKYKGTNEYHIGPMAQDFYNAFALGNDDKHISTIDPSGIALVCIKALMQQNQLLAKRLDEQETLIKLLQK